MKVKLLSLFFLLIVAFCWTSCEDEDDPSAGAYASGVFVVNEGGFGGTGTVTWYDPSTGATETDIFANNNGGAELGQFAQSLTFHADKAYIVVNGANKIVVVDANTFKFITTIEGLVLPRFMEVVDNNTAWVTQWGQDGLDGSVAKIDLTTNTVLKTIPLGDGPEKIFRDGNTLYIPNSGGFGTDSTVSIVNMVTETEQERRVVAGKNPCCAAELNNEIWVLCKGSFLDPLPTGYVVNLNTGAAISTFPYGDDLLRASDNSLRFAAGPSIWKLSGSTLSGFINTGAYALGFDAQNNRLYGSDARDFASDGQVLIYSLDGVKLDSFTVGVIPGEIVFR